MDQNNEFELSPEELQKTLIGFLGHTYKEISQFDSRLVSPNNTLSPKKQEFENIANRVFQETLKPNSGQIPIGNVNHNPHHQQLHPTNGLHQNVQPNIQVPQLDPNQLEFSFDNSVTALSIDKKLTDIENKLKKLDTMMSKMLVYMEENDTTDIKQI